MATLEINGQRISVDDSFLRLSPQEQEATVNEIARALGVDTQASQYPEGATVDETGRPLLQASGFENRDLTAPASFETMGAESVNRADPAYWAGEASRMPAQFAESAIESIPVAGPLIRQGTDTLASALWDIPVEDLQAVRADYNSGPLAPIAQGAGAAYGTMAPLAGVAGTQLGGNLLGVTGPWLRRGLAGGVSGGAIAGADTLARGGDTNDALQSALLGGVLGAAAGAASPLADQFMAGIAQRAAGNPNAMAAELSPGARQGLARVLAGDEVFAGGVGQNIARGGPDAMMADAGPASQTLLDAAIARGGPGASGAAQAVNARANAASADINTVLDDIMGPPVGLGTAESALRTGTAPARGQLYDAAYNAPIDYSSAQGQAIMDMLDRVPAGAWSRVDTRLQVEGIPVPNRADPNYRPSVQELDVLTQELNSLARSTEVAGAMGANTPLGTGIQNLSRDIRTNLRQAVPEYEMAVTFAAVPIEAREALRFGESALSTRVTRDEVAQFVSGMTPPQREAALMGVRSRIDEVLANVRAVASDPNIDARQATQALRELSSPASREKMALLIGDQAQVDALYGVLDQAAQALQLRASVARGSQTYPRQAAEEGIRSQIDDGIWNSVLQGRPVNAVQEVVQSITGRTASGRQEIADAVWAEMANALTGLRGQQAQELAEQILAMASNPQMRATLLPGIVQMTESELIEQLQGGPIPTGIPQITVNYDSDLAGALMGE